jgi:tetratricopeptide (TPR) repeat protein
VAASALIAAPSRIEAQVKRIRALMEAHRFADALGSAQALCAEVPENRDVLYMIAVSQRYLGRIPEALATLQQLESLHPLYSRLFQERGHCHVALREAEPAIAAFSRAVNLNSALPASWKALQALFRMIQRTGESDLAATQVDALAKLPTEILAAASLFADGELYPAEVIARQYLRKHGTHAEALHLLAKIAMAHGALDDAQLLLESVLGCAPDHHAARYDFVRTLLARNTYANALEELDKLLALEPGNRPFRTAYATALVGLGEVERGIALYRELLAETPAAPELHLSIGHALKSLGRTREAIDAYRAAAALRPDYGDAYWSLANLKTYRFSDDELLRMRGAESARTTAPIDRIPLSFAIAKALEDRAAYAESFQHYERGNALQRVNLCYRADLTERNARLQAGVCTREFFAARAGYGFASAEPIFIVGLPRSGSTLLEQILSSHSQVEGTMELPEVPRIVTELRGREADDAEPRYPPILADLSEEDLRRMGALYLANTRAFRGGKSGGVRHFIDKMPNNFAHIGLIHLLFPNAKIIDARRAGLACCFSNFKQLFAAGQEFTYAIEDIARYYCSYVQLMDHWDAVLPGKILRVQYEDVVADLEGQVHALLRFCGLEFESACLEFYKTERNVRTASSEQVRRPIFTEGLDQWRHFEPWLGPLRAALGPLAERARVEKLS